MRLDAPLTSIRLYGKTSAMWERIKITDLMELLQKHDNLFRLDVMNMDSTLFSKCRSADVFASLHQMESNAHRYTFYSMMIDDDDGPILTVSLPYGYEW